MCVFWVLRCKRKYDHISNIRKSQKKLCMQNCRLLHSFCLMFRIKNRMAPLYLCDRIACNRDIHSHNTRSRYNIRVPLARTNMRAMSFFIYISNKFNELPADIETSGVSIHTFKSFHLDLDFFLFSLNVWHYQAPQV